MEIELQATYIHTVHTVCRWVPINVSCFKPHMCIHYPLYHDMASHTDSYVPEGPGGPLGPGGPGLPRSPGKP